MAKLDKQGLNAFIRELDKHINTKINRLDISPTAEKVMMADGTSVEESVSANKTSIHLLQEEIDVNKEILENHEHNYQKHRLTRDDGCAMLFGDKDLNQLLNTGVYTISNPKNAPITVTWAYVEVILHGTKDFALQRFVQLTGNTQPSFYYRIMAGGTWHTWIKLSSTSTYSLLEQQISELETQATENEKKISILESENKELKEELTQIQTSIASLTSLITATLEEK